MVWSSFIVDAPQEPHETTRMAVAHLAAKCPRSALDIGAGNGRDSKFLASAGCDVTAVDFSKASSALLRDVPGIRFVCADICIFPLERYDLINASLVFPFIERESFLALWFNLQNATALKGILCGHFFGMRDWKVESKVAWGLEHAAVLELLEPFEVKYLHEHLAEGLNQRGDAVTKHNFSFVARVAA